MSKRKKKDNIVLYQFADKATKTEWEQYIDKISDDKKKQDFSDIADEAMQFIVAGHFNWRSKVIARWDDQYDKKELFWFLHYMHFKNFTTAERAEIRQLVHNKYLDLLELADINEATRILDAITKLHGLNEIQVENVTKWAVQLGPSIQKDQDEDTVEVEYEPLEPENEDPEEE